MRRTRATVPRSRGKEECFGTAAAEPKCETPKQDVTEHSRLVCQELDLICNHNFV
jgi:hypothetical protein